MSKRAGASLLARLHNGCRWVRRPYRLMDSKLWYVAVGDRDGALQAAWDAAGHDAAYAEIQIVGELTQAEIDHLGLQLGYAQQKS